MRIAVAPAAAFGPAPPTLRPPERITLRVENLTVRRADRTILRDLSLEAPPGEAVLLVGPNGAGKTTLLRTLAGLIRPASGSITLTGAGTEVRETEPEVIAERCHLVGHLNAVKSSLTVAENARFWCRYLGGAEDDVMPALDTFRLADLAPIRAGYLSAGQKRRLGLARLLLAPRPIWLLDEPATSLDVASQSLLATCVNGHLAAGGIVLAATHQPLGLSPARELRLGPRTSQTAPAGSALGEASR